MNNQINVLLVSNHRYYPGLAATMTSMLISSSEPERLQFFVYHDDLTEDDRANLNVLHAKYHGVLPIVYRVPDVEPIRALGPEWNGSYLPWVRLFVCYELDVDWIVYADVDTLWFKDICQLWDLKDDKTPLYACRDLEYVQKDTYRYQSKWNPQFVQDKYFCSGMMVMNLRDMRKTNLPKQVHDFIQKNGCPYYPDQDILNHLYNGRCEILEQTWNCMRPDRKALKGAVLHCLGIGRMFNGPMLGWSGTAAIWYRFYNKHILGEKKVHGRGFLRSCWYHVFGLLYPCRLLYKVLTIPCASHRAEQLTNMQFAAWLYAHSGFGR